MIRLVSMVVVAMATGLLHPAVFAEDVQAVRDRLLSLDHNWASSGSGPLCGVYSSCAALQLLGYPCSPARYCSIEFVGSARGSTADQIVAIARDAGAQASVLSNLSGIDLRWLDTPLIVNVRSTPVSSNYDHWAAVVPQDGALFYYDGLQPPRQIPMGELLGIWNGVGVVVARPERPAWLSIWLGRLLVFLLGIAVVLATQRLVLMRQRSGRRSRTFEVAAILGASILVACVGVGLAGGLSEFAGAARLATAPYRSYSFQSADLDELHRAGNARDKLLIDARFPADYQEGSVQGAVNVPVNASMLELRELFADVPRDAPIIVFCQSERCEFDESIAKSLTVLGFQNVETSEAGWAEYHEAYP